LDAQVSGSKASDAATTALKRLLAANLLSARTAAGLTQDELGSRSGLGRAYIYRVEKASNNLTLESLTAISMALAIPVDKLLSASATGAEQHQKIQLDQYVVGSILQAKPGTMAIELPVNKAFEVARIVASHIGSAVPLIDPVTRVVSGIAGTIPPERDVRDAI
jgi:transcriptional regulator with XRE-family HTH domain